MSLLDQFMMWLKGHGWPGGVCSPAHGSPRPFCWPRLSDSPHPWKCSRVYQVKSHKLPTISGRKARQSELHMEFHAVRLHGSPASKIRKVELWRVGCEPARGSTSAAAQRRSCPMNTGPEAWHGEAPANYSRDGQHHGGYFIHSSATTRQPGAWFQPLLAAAAAFSSS